MKQTTPASPHTEKATTRENLAFFGWERSEMITLLSENVVDQLHFD